MKIGNLKLLDGGNQKVEPTPALQNSKDKGKSKRTKTNLEDIRLLIENFPEMDTFYHHETLSFMGAMKEEIAEIKAAETTGTDGQRDGTFLEVYDLMLTDFDENPKLALHFMKEWVELRGEQAKAQKA